MDLWDFDLTLPEGGPDLHVFQRWLSADERERAGKYHFPRDARRYTVCRGYLRRVLSQYLNIHPKEVTFSYGVHGKPSLGEGGEGLHFNVSHSRDRAVIAVRWNRPVGVDIEYLEARDNVEGIAALILGSEELSFYQGQLEKRRLRCFFEFWTLKESLLKAKGIGFFENPQNIAVLRDGKFLPRRFDADAPSGFFSLETRSCPEYQLGICVDGELPELRFRGGAELLDAP